MGSILVTFIFWGGLSSSPFKSPTKMSQKMRMLGISPWKINILNTTINNGGLEDDFPFQRPDF